MVFRFLVAVVVYVASVGCIAQIQSHETRLTALETGIEDKRAELEQVLVDAGNVVKRNSADQGVQIQELQSQVAELQGQIAELNNKSGEGEQATAVQLKALQKRVDEVARTAGVDFPLPAEQIPTDKSAHYRAAKKAFAAGQHSRARALLRTYVQKYSKDSKADDAQHAVGLSYLHQNRPAEALGEFRLVVANYRKGDIMDRALVDMASAFVQVRECGDAKKALTAMLKDYKGSPLVDQAKRRLKWLDSGQADCR